MHIPSALIDLRKADTALGHAPRQQAVVRKRARLFCVVPIQRPGAVRLVAHIREFRQRSLHAERHLVLMNARVGLRVTNFFKRHLIDCIHSVDQRAPGFSTHALWIAKVKHRLPLRTECDPGIFV